MELFDQIVITEIQPPYIVHSKKGRKFQMADRQSYGLSLCISGQITYTMDGKTYVSNQSNAILLPQGGTYSLYGDKEGFFPVVNFKCSGFECKQIKLLPLDNAQACLQGFEALKSLFLHGENRLNIYSAFYALLSNVSYSDSHARKRLEPIIRYISENIRKTDLSNTVLARQLGISEVYLRKLFLSCYNITPRQYILDLRIRAAKQMIADTPFTITAIAEECGFTSLYHFCRVFKQRTGFTPTQYAAANRIHKP